LRSRANHLVLLGVAFLCGAALFCSDVTRVGATEPPAPNPILVADFPVASDARLAGDSKQTRFVLDLDKAIRFRAFALADPYRVVVDMPEVNFQLAAGIGTAGRGLIKAFRYGLVLPGGSRIVFDLAGPARIANS
jgi:N-acetylmuramoyl-L-alanine amidase